MIDAQLQRFKSNLLWQIRSWFNHKGYLEVMTPVRVISPALEHNLIAISSENKWLRTSPEFALKKAISSGLHRVYEIGSCFRSEESGPHHSSEFTMLEFYQVGSGLWAFMDEVINLLNACAEWAQLQLPNWEFIPSHELLDPNLSPEDWFFQWVDQIEPNLPNACVVHSYPKWQAALSKVNQKHAERFEVYWNGIELGNAFHEELSGENLISRWLQSNELRKNCNLPPHPIDHSFIEANTKMPRCSGIAIGLERLLICLSNENHIQAFQIPSGIQEFTYDATR